MIIEKTRTVTEKSGLPQKKCGLSLKTRTVTDKTRTPQQKYGLSQKISGLFYIKFF